MFRLEDTEQYVTEEGCLVSRYRQCNAHGLEIESITLSTPVTQPQPKETTMNEVMTDAELEQALETRPSSVRVTAEQIKDRIERVDYHQIGATVTLCNVTLNNGYSVRGESACVDPTNFDEAIGQKLAFDNAFKKLWPLFGFLLAESRFRDAAGGVNRSA